MKNKKSSNRSFGILFFVVFLILGLWPLFKSQNPSIFLLCISGVFLILGFLNSKILTPLNKLWIRFGILLGKIVSPIVMGVVYFGVVTPIGIIMRLFGKDILNLEINKNKSTYWLPKDKIKSEMKNQF